MIWYKYSELDEHGEISNSTNGIIKQVFSSFFTAREMNPSATAPSMLTNVAISHFNKYKQLDYRFTVPGFNIVGEISQMRTTFQYLLDQLMDDASALILMYAKDKDVTFGQSDENTWTDNDRKLEVNTNYGSTSKTGIENSPIGSTYDGDIVTPANKNQNEIEGDSDRTETKSGSSTETRVRQDNTTMIEKYWAGTKNFDGVLDKLFKLMTYEFTYCD